ncbi:MAG: ABC transporter ATP-binding protein [Sphaerochaetaceae bacterium]
MDILRKYFPKYKRLFFLAVFCVSLESICDLMGPTFMAQILNKGIEKQSLAAVYYWGGLMILATAFGAVFAISRNILASKVSQSFGADLRYDLFSKILHISGGDADKIENGSLITRMTGDVTQVTQAVNGTMRIFIKAPVTCIGSIILASVLNLRLSIIVYCIVIVVGFLIYISMKLSYPLFFRLQKAMDRINTRIEEYLIGIRLVKAFGTYDNEIQKFDTDNTTLMNSGVKAQMIITLIAPLLTLTVGLGTATALYFGSILFGKGLTHAGDISAFTVYMAQILSSLLMITNIFNIFVRTKASLERIKEVFTSKDDFPQSNVKEQLAGSVQFEDVSFSYPKGSGIPAINHISFALKEGESLAIIGPTGSGKSTITWLMLRLYDVDKGRILLGGKDIRNLGSDVLRQNIALVPQKAMLVSGTVRENLLWGNSEASDESIEEALIQTDALFVHEMGQGLSSTLSSGATNLSGGQKQRLSIARGLIKDCPVLVLDDATSALDAITEAKVRSNLLSHKNNKTIILVTQRCSTAMGADKILVLENGYCLGLGSHQQLLKECQVYKDIYDSQLGGLDNGTS